MNSFLNKEYAAIKSHNSTCLSFPEKKPKIKLTENCILALKTMDLSNKKITTNVIDGEKQISGQNCSNGFKYQIHRKDILENMLQNKNLGGPVLFKMIMNENRESRDRIREGWIYESLNVILTATKCFTNIDYTEINEGQLQNLKKVKDFNNLLRIKIASGGDNKSDMTIKQGDVTIPFSIKYRDEFCETDVCILNSTMKRLNTNYKIGLFVKDKKIITNHVYHNQLSENKILHDEIIKNGMLFDEEDVICALDRFCQVFSSVTSSVTSNVDDFIDYINSEYLLYSRQRLVKKLHQQMSLLKFIKTFGTNKSNNWCIAHKPRSGKSITILLFSKYLLESGHKKILIMTSVPATIDSFTNDLEKWIDFKNINYKLQCDFDTIDDDFNGIVFCSVQYLKMDADNKKKDFLKKYGFDAFISDESHLGSSTHKTRTDILEVDRDVEDICKNIKINIFASGTADKTKQYYNINSKYIFEWDITDEAYMKLLAKSDLEIEMYTEIVQLMSSRHGDIFEECLKNQTLNKDYLKHPTQVLMKYSIKQSLIEKIDKYNADHGTKYGFSCATLFALQQFINEKKEVEYAEDFELCNSVDGEEILVEFCESIISQQKMKETIMKQIENTQASYNSRKSTRDNPLLFIIYLPTHTGNNTISKLQKTLKLFLEKHGLWSDYNIEYSNSMEDTGAVKERYNDYIQSIMNKTKTERKRGCILLLGSKGSVGITYNDCDVTISLDDGHNLDNQKQRFSRALTEATGKTIGINVDMNIQRSYLYVLDIINNYKKNIKTNKSYAEILYHLFENKIFLFDPQEFNNGKLKTIEIVSYYQKETEIMMREIDDTTILEKIECDDVLLEHIKDKITKIILQNKINTDLEGEQQDCPKGEKERTQIDAPEESTGVKECKKLDESEVVKNEILINQTYEMCKSFLFPLLALISKSYNLYDFNDIFRDEKTKKLIISLLKDKIKDKIELNKDNYNIIVEIMNTIIVNNEEVVNKIREIYGVAPSGKLRELIAKHFIPTSHEHKQHAEIPTPVKLVDDILNRIPEEFWKTPHKVFEPCCGKGNFVLGIFDRFYNGLKEQYPDEIERCRVIMTECIYYADLTHLNVFITTEIMKCHIQSYCGLDDFDFHFNKYTGDTLEINIEDTWNIHLKDITVITNPPYSTDPSKPNTKSLYDKFIEKYINGKLLLVVIPSRWFIGGKGLDGFRDFMMKRKDIVFIQHEENSKKWFGNHVDIEGGCNYFLKDASYEGLCLFNGEPYDLSKYDCVIKPKYHELIDAVVNMESISKLYMGRCFGIETNDKRFKNNGKIKCYVSLKQSKDRCKYIDAYEFTEKNTFWKVITARANGKSPNFGEKFIGNIYEVHTGSYISFRVNNEDEGKSLLSYLDTTFANYMLSIRKISQDISENTCKWIPLVPLDRIWTDDKVCEYLKIDKAMYI